MTLQADNTIFNMKQLALIPPSCESQHLCSIGV